MAKGNGNTRQTSQEEPDFFLTNPENYFIAKETDFTTGNYEDALRGMGDTMESFAWEHRKDDGNLTYRDRITHGGNYIFIDYGKDAKGLEDARIKAVGGEVIEQRDKKGNLVKRTFTPSYEVKLGNVTYNPNSKDYDKFVARYSKFHGGANTKQFSTIEKAYDYIQQQRRILGKLKLD